MLKCSIFQSWHCIQNSTFSYLLYNVHSVCLAFLGYNSILFINQYNMQVLLTLTISCAICLVLFMSSRWPLSLTTEYRVRPLQKLQRKHMQYGYKINITSQKVKKAANNFLYRTLYTTVHICTCGWNCTWNGGKPARVTMQCLGEQSCGSTWW